jgi:hypothetical protein
MVKVMMPHIMGGGGWLVLKLGGGGGAGLRG